MFVTSENHCRIASQVTKKTLGIHGKPCIILYVLEIVNKQMKQS